MLSTPAPAAAPPMGGGFGGLIDTGPTNAGGLNDLFSIQSALPGSGYVAPPTVGVSSDVKRCIFTVGKIAEKAVCSSVFLTTWHCTLSAEITKNALLQTFFLRFCPLG